MNDDEAGCLQKKWNAKHSDKSCRHDRVVEYHMTQDGCATGKLVCRECGAIYSDQLKCLPDPSPPC